MNKWIDNKCKECEIYLEGKKKGKTGEPIRYDRRNNKCFCILSEILKGLDAKICEVIPIYNEVVCIK